jgi:hypothetical protein
VRIQVVSHNCIDSHIYAQQAVSQKEDPATNLSTTHTLNLGLFLLTLLIDFLESQLGFPGDRLGSE